jgi:hypothetical protein
MSHWTLTVVTNVNPGGSLAAPTLSTFRQCGGIDWPRPDRWHEVIENVA